VTEWFKYIEGEKVADDCRNLGLWDRYLVGGPWMNKETCAVYLNYMLSAGQPVLVAEVDTKIAGEIDVFVGEEPPPLERNACISVLEVAKNFRRKGVGKALVRRAIRLAKKAIARQSQ